MKHLKVTTNASHICFAGINGLNYSLAGVQKRNLKQFPDMSKWIVRMMFMPDYFPDNKYK